MAGIGFARREDARHLMGRALFVGDRLAKGTLHAGFVRSEIASGRIDAIDCSAARGMPGVVAVYTADDLRRDGIKPLGHVNLPRDDGQPAGCYAQSLLVDGVVQHMAEPVAMVIARNPAQLADAIEAVGVEISETPPLNGIAFHRCLGDRDKTAAAFDMARHRVSVRIDIPRVTATAMEPRGGIATGHADGALHYTSSTQNPFAVRDQLAGHFGWDTQDIHVEAQDVGGSFGLKGYMAREDALLCWAARKLNVSVAWFATRSESILADAQGRGVTGRIDLAISQDLSLLGLDAAFTIDVGAYPDRRSMGLMNNANGLTGMYDIRAVAVEVTGELSARAPLAPFRGNGRPEATYAIERALDQAARQIGCDPLDLRRRNLLPPQAFPLTTALGTAIDCGDYPSVMAKALALSDGVEDRRRDAAARGRLFGFGLANCVESSGGPARGPKPDHARLTVSSVGRVSLAPGVMSVGQGHETALSRMVAERLGLGLDLIDYRNGDTHAVVHGRGSGGSSGLTVAGSAVWVALDKLLDDGRAAAAKHLGTSADKVTYRDGAFFREGSNESVALGAIAAARPGETWVIEASFTPTAATFPNGSHVCEVEIDPETGQVRITRYAAVEDVGRVLNPVLVDGQLHGGIAQGLSLGLGERMVYDDAGQILTGSFMDYQVARAADLPMYRLGLHEVPTKLNPLGVKGVGEAGAVGATAAFGLAVSDALARAGVADFDLPATPGRVWQALHDAGVAGAV